MKSSQFSIFFVASSVAHSSILNTHDHVHQHSDICSQKWLPLMPVCHPDNPAGRDIGPPDLFKQHPVGGGQARGNDSGHDLQVYSNWTQTSPCFRSPSSGEELCVFSDSNFAFGRGTAFATTAQRAAFLANRPAFSDPETVRGINQDLQRTVQAKYEMKEIPGKGKGLTATDYIRRGELIMANTASLMFDYKIFDNLDQDQYRTLKASAVDSLPAAHRAAILGLSTQDEDARNMSYLALIDKVASTNAFDIDPEEDDDEQDSTFYVVFPEIARMNHDCRPNGDYYFDWPKLTQYVHALRDIFPGEELTLSYINPIQKRRERIARLQRSWGFQCSCPLCTAEAAVAEASDARIKAIDDLHPDLKNYRPESRATPQLAELLISLYQQEKLFGFMYEAYTLAALEYNGVGDPWTASKYAYLAIEHGIPVVGADDNDLVEMRKLAKDPFAHWSWMLRTRKRMATSKAATS